MASQRPLDRICLYAQFPHPLFVVLGKMGNCRAFDFIRYCDNHLLRTFILYFLAVEMLSIFISFLQNDGEGSIVKHSEAFQIFQVITRNWNYSPYSSNTV